MKLLSNAATIYSNVFLSFNMAAPHPLSLSLSPPLTPVKSSGAMLHQGALKVAATDQSAPIDTPTM